MDKRDVAVGNKKIENARRGMIEDLKNKGNLVDKKAKQERVKLKVLDVQRLLPDLIVAEAPRFYNFERDESVHPALLE